MRTLANLKIKEGKLEIIRLPTSDQGGSIGGSKVGSEIYMRAKILEGGCSYYNIGDTLVELQLSVWTLFREKRV